MMNLLARLLLITFMAITSAQTCPICPQGEPPSNSNVVVYQHNDVLWTCKAIAKEFINYPSEDCNGEYDYALQYICGCRGAMSGPCPGICPTGSVLTNPKQITDFIGSTCLAFDQVLKGKPGAATCPKFSSFNYKEVCTCKVKVIPSSNNMGGGIMGMSSGFQLRNGGLDENFPPRSAHGLTM